MTDPTARADAIAEEVRRWYDANRETWWQRHAPFFLGGSYIAGCADNFIIELINVVNETSAKHPK